MDQVKELRDRTGAGILDCKNVLNQTNGDMDAAIKILREKGLASAAKKADRTASDSREEVPAAELDREREILREQNAGSNKPANIIEKIVEGRIEKFYGEVALLE